MMVFDWNQDMVQAAKKLVINAAGRIMWGRKNALCQLWMRGVSNCDLRGFSELNIE